MHFAVPGTGSGLRINTPISCAGRTFLKIHCNLVWIILDIFRSWIRCLWDLLSLPDLEGRFGQLEEFLEECSIVLANQPVQIDCTRNFPQI